MGCRVISHTDLGSNPSTTAEMRANLSFSEPQFLYLSKVKHF